MSPLRRLLPYYYRYKRPFWAGVFMLLFARALEGVIPLLLRESVDAIAAALPQVRAGATTPGSAREALILPVVGILLCVVLRVLTMAHARRVIRRIAVHVAYDLRKRVYSHLQLQGPAFFARNPTGDLMARAINDISLVRELVGSGSRTILVNVTMILVGLACMLALAPLLTLMLLVPMIPIAIVGSWAGRRVYARSMAVQKGFSDLSAKVQGNLNGIRTIQALVQEENEIRRFDVISNQYVDRFHALMRLNSFISAVVPWMAAFSVVVVIGYGGSMVQSGAMSLGTFAAFFAYIGMVLWPVSELGNMVTIWQRGASGARRLFEVLDEAPDVLDDPDPSAPEVIEGSIELRALSYRYPQANAPALRDLNVVIPKGETLAIMGRVGAGKTTLLSCLVRLLDPPPDSLLIDGVDVRRYPLGQLRSQVVLVPQDPFLFAQMLRHNLSYDDPEREVERIWSTVDDVDLSATVRELGQQLDTPIGERGVTLSGGQKQRSALARGLIQDAAVLVLDDCLSAVDTKTEEHILDRLFRVRAGRTTLLVTNRVSTARHADRILILEDGRIADCDSHAALIERGGWYAHLARTQRLEAQDVEAIA
jgi:ATP-binding cassette subfamily B protein